jgi:hypothetical protein
VASEPEALLQVLTNTIYRFKRIGLEAGPLSQWLYSVLAEAGFPGTQVAFTDFFAEVLEHRRLPHLLQAGARPGVGFGVRTEAESRMRTECRETTGTGGDTIIQERERPVERR